MIKRIWYQDWDRISREPAYHFLLEQEFKKHGTILKAINDWGGDTPEGQLIKYERALIAERTRRGRLQRAREGKIVSAGSPPVGFLYDPEIGNYR